ncbi:MAG: SGNH/GDSL hydrolase family protein [Eubacteriales bacterium]
MNFLKKAKYIIAALLAAIILFPAQAVRAADVFDSVVFFGDSTTAHLAVRGGMPRYRVWSGQGNTVKFSSVNSEKCVLLSSGECFTLYEAVKREKPAILVITLGVSGGAGVLSKEDFQDIYKKMLLSVKEASPQTEIFVQSILPLSDKSVKYYKKITKEAVVEANLWIREVCASLSVPYINTHDLLISENGYLKPEYQNDEYMHLTSQAYKIILANIRQAISNKSKG